MARLGNKVQTGGPVLSAEFAELLRLARSLFDPYRPELHYMRGPGPKWHAKHALAPAKNTPTGDGPIITGHRARKVP